MTKYHMCVRCIFCHFPSGAVRGFWVLSQYLGLSCSRHGSTVTQARRHLILWCRVASANLQCSNHWWTTDKVDRALISNNKYQNVVVIYLLFSVVWLRETKGSGRIWPQRLISINSLPNVVFGDNISRSNVERKMWKWTVWGRWKNWLDCCICKTT